MNLSQSQVAVLMVLFGLAAIISGVWVAFGTGWASIVGGVIVVLLGIGFAYDAVARASEKAE